MHKWLRMTLLSQFPSRHTPFELNPENQLEPPKTPQQKQGCYLSGAFIALIMILIFKAIDNEWNTNIIPYTFFEFWPLKGSFKEGLQAAIPVFCWGLFMTTVAIALAPSWMAKREADKIDPAFLLTTGCFTSFFAGIFEEISFRWLFFFNGIAGNKAANYIFLGFMDHGIPKWIFQHIGAPIANWMTFGLVHDIIYNPLGWFVGAAILASNAAFRDGHKLNGPVGWLNSWYIGMFFFWLMFNYGLPVAILAHIIYDLLIFIEVSIYFTYVQSKSA